jgi:hypothetical protein
LFCVKNIPPVRPVTAKRKPAQPGLFHSSSSSFAGILQGHMVATANFAVLPIVIFMTAKISRRFQTVERVL